MLQRVQAIRRLSQWVLNHIVQEVPEDSALCEFDCRKGQCTVSEWATCERRLCHAQGELMPAPNKVDAPPSDSQTEATAEASAVNS